VQHLLFAFLEHAGFLARGDEHLQLFFGVDHRMAIGTVETEQTDIDWPRRAQADERPEDAHEDFQRLYGPQRDGLRSFERDPFRRQLSEHHLDAGDARKCDGKRDGVRGRRGNRHRQKRELRLDDRRKCRLAGPAQSEARHRDAELRGGDVAVRRADRAPDRAGSVVPFGNQLIDAGLAHRDDGNSAATNSALASTSAARAASGQDIGHKSLSIWSSGHLVKLVSSSGDWSISSGPWSVDLRSPDQLTTIHLTNYQ
jgi:hypothetical protein